MSRRRDALELAEELLSDIELNRLSGQDIARKASRLARIANDFDATTWLRYEVSGYPEGSLDADSVSAAKRSGRETRNDDGETRYWTASIGTIQAIVNLSHVQIEASRDAPVSISSANPSQYVSAPSGNTGERSALRNQAVQYQGKLDKVLGAIHQWVSELYYELRFGGAVEDAFTVVRTNVDGKISALVPDALVKLTSAFENSVSGNPEDWAGAASTCRRLIKSVADSLRPPGDPVDGRKMGDGNYINRLIDWIVNHSSASETYRDVIVADLSYLGRRLDALADAGNKGAHAEVTQYEASRYIAGTYLFLGDILMLHEESEKEQGEA
ncbi:hypothetical protein ACFV16_24670 [Streptomyces massasporeus]|uniref:AbiTii domain-containing protein n=1 Tax=Streptomyces massasporeus TaxID=67324 RepID=UPI0036C2F5FD